ncbi:hypothetical protein GMLC_26180 [Geomonas limicola]|uniref:TonB C-terminal domain-containing protein n=1 Tax=Geomonas limicola TaxID=2740186 RepID=A0A6V8ND30_9BACT|nr:energy transducer TonB [Geomonas limicola]GFO69039.1 hypothetical protein GMLC_26180 [Geomonas limicola]
MTHDLHGMPRFGGPLLVSLALHLVLLLAVTGVRWSMQQVPKGAPEDSVLHKDPLAVAVQVDLSSLPLPGVGSTSFVGVATRPPAAEAAAKQTAILPVVVAPARPMAAATDRKGILSPAAAPVAAALADPLPASKGVSAATAGTVPGSSTTRTEPHAAATPQQAALGAPHAAGPGAAGAGASGAASKAGAGQGAQAGGGGAGNSGAVRRGSYQGRIKALIEAHKKYPVAARKLGREGRCDRRLVLARDGSLKQVDSVSSCGHPFLDAAATRAITEVGTFPPLPEEFGAPQESFTVTLSFSLSDGR